MECPSCGSSKLYKDGFRVLANGEAVQRFLCRDCGYRFSEPTVKFDVPNQVKRLNAGSHLAKTAVSNGDFSAKKVLNNSSFSLSEDVGSHNVTVIGKGLNALCSYNSNRQICALTEKAKNLDTVTETKTVAGENKPLDLATKKGLLLQYELYLQKEGYGEKCRYNNCIRILLNAGADVYDPENVKAVIAKKKCKDGTKMQMTYAYDAMVKMLKLGWEMPTYKQEEILPFIPDEKELDALILGAKSKRMAIYLQTLKETMADPSEALRIEWTDINGNVVTINHPVKNHYPRQIEVSNTLIAQLNSMPKTDLRVFATTYQNIARNFWQLRKMISRNLANPRIMKISPVTFRHWGATMTYHYTQNILLVKKLLGHKNIKNTMKYTQLVEFKDSEFETATATTVEDARKLGEAGFQKFDEFNGIHIYRKPKRFVSLA